MQLLGCMYIVSGMQAFRGWNASVSRLECLHSAAEKQAFRNQPPRGISASPYTVPPYLGGRMYRAAPPEERKNQPTEPWLLLKLTLETSRHIINHHISRPFLEIWTVETKKEDSNASAWLTSDRVGYPLELIAPDLCYAEAITAPRIFTLS